MTNLEKLRKLREQHSAGVPKETISKKSFETRSLYDAICENTYKEIQRDWEKMAEDWNKVAEDFKKVGESFINVDTYVDYAKSRSKSAAFMAQERPAIRCEFKTNIPIDLTQVQAKFKGFIVVKQENTSFINFKGKNLSTILQIVSFIEKLENENERLRKV